MISKRRLSRSPEIVLIDLRNLLRAGAVGNGPEPNFRQRPKINQI
jgi:hypothetical protein